MNNADKQMPSLPAELVRDFDETAAEIYAQWRAMSTDEVVAATPYSQVAMFDNGQSVRYADLIPPLGDHDPEQTSVMVLPAAKIWSPETFITAEVIRQLTVPTGRLIVLPNNNVGQRAYMLSEAERAKLAARDLSPISERHVRLCESLGITTLELIIGHSFGATEGASLANIGAGIIVARVHAFDEAPNTFVPGTRSRSKLHRAMTVERTLVKPNLEGIGLPAFSDITNINRPFKFTYGLARYALGGQYIAPNSEINQIFRGNSFFADVQAVLRNNPDTKVSISNAESSLVCNIPATIAFVKGLKDHMGDAATNHTLYEGQHVTGGSSPWTLGLLGRRAMAVN